MSKTISNLSVLKKIYHIADIIEDYIHNCLASCSLFIRPGAVYRKCQNGSSREKGHAAIGMLIESYELQRSHAEQLVNELKALDNMLDECGDGFSDLILEQFAHSWYEFNSESSPKNFALLYFLRETIPASIYWQMNEINEEKLLEQVRKSED